MLRIISSIVFVGIGAFAQTSEVIILSQAKSKKKAYLNIVTINKYVHFFQGYPKLVKSRTVPGLKPGLWVWLGGYCKRDETVPFVQDKTTNTPISIVLDEQKYFVQKLKKVVTTAYTKTVSVDEASCPIYNVEKDVRYMPSYTPSTAGLMWHKKPFSLPELSRYALDINKSIPAASNYLAAYGYKYLQKDENLLQIIFENNSKLK